MLPPTPPADAPREERRARLKQPLCRTTRADPDPLALVLIATWAARTGRTLRAPIDSLTPAELEEFWADDQLEPLHTPPTSRTLR